MIYYWDTKCNDKYEIQCNIFSGCGKGCKKFPGCETKCCEVQKAYCKDDKKCMTDRSCEPDGNCFQRINTILKEVCKKSNIRVFSFLKLAKNWHSLSFNSLKIVKN